MKITMAHGSGGIATSNLIADVFEKHFNNDILSRMEDSAVVTGSARIAITTDSFVVTPLFFRGGDIGKLAVCGTVNDLLMSGAIPKYLTCGFIIEEGALISDLDKIAHSMAQAALLAGVKIVAGDTKVVEGTGGIFINTSGVGFVPSGRNLHATNCLAGDKVLLSGTLGDHHATILSSRMGIKNNIESDCQPLNCPVDALLSSGITVRTMRDVTRGGLATVLNEIAEACNCGINVDELQLPVTESVKGLCDILGLDPLYMANEGKFIAVISEADAEKAQNILLKIGFINAKIVGSLTERSGVRLTTRLGGITLLDKLFGEGLPRIC